MKKYVFISFVFIFLPLTANSKPVEQITAKALYAVFDNNEIAAEERFKGNEVVITGTVKNVKKNIASQPIVTLDAGTLKFVSCRFPKASINQLLNMQKGSQARFTCTVDHKIISTIHLSNCAIR